MTEAPLLTFLADALALSWVAESIHKGVREERFAPEPLAVVDALMAHPVWQAEVNRAQALSKCSLPPLRLVAHANSMAARLVGVSWAAAEEFALSQSRRMLAAPGCYEDAVELFPAGDEVLFKAPLGGRYVVEGPWNWRLFPDGLKRYPWNAGHFSHPQYYR